MFQYPSTNFNEINLNWIMETLKELEPAVGMISEAEAALLQANEVAAQAAQTATDANNAVSSVTALATAADTKADTAITIATQAASATIADGSVTIDKLSNDVQLIIEDADTNATAANGTANNALAVANSAAQSAGDAQQASTAAQQSANEAITKAEQALEMGFANWIRYANIGGSGLSLPHEVDTPLAKEYLVVFYTSQTANRRQTMTIPYAALALGTNYYWCEISGIVAAVKADASKFIFDDTSPLGAAVIYIR